MSHNAWVWTPWPACSSRSSVRTLQVRISRGNFEMIVWSAKTTEKTKTHQSLRAITYGTKHKNIEEICLVKLLSLHVTMTAPNEETTQTGGWTNIFCLSGETHKLAGKARNWQTWRGHVFGAGRRLLLEAAGRRLVLRLLTQQHFWHERLQNTRGTISNKWNNRARITNKAVTIKSPTRESTANESFCQGDDKMAIDLPSNTPTNAN